MPPTTLGPGYTTRTLEDPHARLAALRAADHGTWSRFADRLRPRLLGVARGYRLQPADREDAVQVTLLRLFEHRHRIRSAEALEGWVIVTMRRECLAIAQRPRREQLTDEDDFAGQDTAASPDGALLREETTSTVLQALGALPAHQRRLMHVLVTEPDLSYDEVAERLDMPRGSIGPTRVRALERLRGDDRLTELWAA